MLRSGLATLRRLQAALYHHFSMLLRRVGLSVAGRLGFFSRPCHAVPTGTLEALDTELHRQCSVLGFEEHSVALPSGEAIRYLERKPLRPRTSSSSTLVCLHGLTANPGRMVFNCGDELVMPDDVRVLIPELLGHGSRITHARSSGTVGWTLAEYAADVDALIGAMGIAREEKIDMLGYSLGGGIALKYAELHGARRLRSTVLIAPAAALSAQAAEETRSRKIRYAYSTPAEAVDMCECVGMDLETARKRAPIFLAMRAIAHGEDDAASIKDYWTRMWLALTADPEGSYVPDSQHELKHIPPSAPFLRGARALAAERVRTLIVQSDDDLVCDREGARAIEAAYAHEADGAAPNLCTYARLEGFGHYFHPEQPGKANLLQPAYREASRFLWSYSCDS
jgi:pimeloyl-ACP methyl ester carboxylesterase